MPIIIYTFISLYKTFIVQEMINGFMTSILCPKHVMSTAEMIYATLMQNNVFTLQNKL